jgi:membrane protein
LPAAGLDLIKAQLASLLAEGDRALGIGFLVGRGIALWSANNGIKALFDAMNVASQRPAT